MCKAEGYCKYILYSLYAYVLGAVPKHMHIRQVAQQLVQKLSKYLIAIASQVSFEANV